MSSHTRFSPSDWVIPFEQLRNSDVEVVGGKNAGLGEMISQLPGGVHVPTGFAHSSVALSAGIQRMVRSDLGAAGVMFTMNTESGFEDVVLITASYGLGETVVQGAVNPDEFYVHKPMLVQGKKAVIRRNLGSKIIQMVFVSDAEKAASGKLVKTEDVAVEMRNRYCLSDADVLELGIPAVVGCGNATQQLADGTLVTVSCAEGDAGNIYEGLLEVEVSEVMRGDMPPIDVKIMKNEGICGQGPSDHPNLAQWLREQGISSISLNPDTVVDIWTRLTNG